MWQRSKAGTGVTLLELVIAMAITAVLLGSLMIAYSIGVRSFTEETSQFDLYWDGQNALDQLVEEIRDSLAITSLEAGLITIWYQDLNNDGSMEANEMVSFAQSGSYLVRSSGSSSQPLTKNVQMFVLDFDMPVNPALINIKLTLAKDKSVATLESKVAPRL